MIKNEYTTNGDITTLHITRNNGDIFDVLIDTEDLKVLEEYKYKIHIDEQKKYNRFYASSCMYMGIINDKPHYKIIALHRIILNEFDLYIDHINHNTLDNRKENLRAITNQQNIIYRKGKNSNNKTGYRNVSFSCGKYVVQLQIDGKRTIMGRFEDVHEAGEFAEEMRKKHYGEFAGFGQ